jgi:hypothetical protein
VLVPQAGTDGLGGGGKHLTSSGSSVGGNGGTGIVIIRYDSLRNIE